MNKKAEMAIEKVVGIIIAALVIILFLAFLFFQGSFLNWVKLLPSFGNDQQDKILTVDVPIDTVDNACQLHIGKVVRYDKEINRGSNFIGQYPNICGVLSLPDTCKFFGIYLDFQNNIHLSNSLIGDLDGRIIGNIEGKIIKINPEVFNLNSDFNQRLRIYSFNKNVIDGMSLQNALIQYLIVLDNAHLTDTDLWICKSNEEYTTNSKDSEGNDKIKPAWPKSDNVELINLGENELGKPIKDGKAITLNLPIYLNSDNSKINLYNNGLLVKHSSSWINVLGILDTKLALVTSDGVIWLRGDYLESNFNILNNNKVAVRRSPGIFLSEFGKSTYSIITYFDKKDYYETNLRMDIDYYNNLMVQFNSK
jgi:hypothetical protein